MILLGVLLLLIVLRFFLRSPPVERGGLDTQVSALARQVMAIEAREKQIAETLWGKELLAQHCNQVFENLWDNLNGTSDKFSVLTSFSFGELLSPQYSTPRLLPHDIEVFEPVGPGTPSTLAEWRRRLRESQQAGWQLIQNEFRHVQFDTDPAGRPDRSRYYFSAHLLNPGRQERAIIEGDLIVFWEAPRERDRLPAVRRIDASRLTLRRRQGEPPFREIFSRAFTPPQGSFFIDPLILHDLDGDGLSEIILAARNQVLRRRSDGSFDVQPLCRSDPGLIFTGLLADFDNDGAADFLCAKFDGLYLFKGSLQGTFDEPGRLVWTAQPHLKYAQALTCGDIDDDGDLDVWLGQYKVPYDRGQMPTPYYDANDGDPSYLLLNDGQGNLADATASAGLVPKRRRRAYSASFADFNRDGHLDLIVACDFAGLDLYANDGHGHFSDVTAASLPESHSFGMCQLSADFNRDGLLDLLMIGMNVPVADRLVHLATARPGFEHYLAFMGPMTYGNRLFIAQPTGPYQQTPLNDSIARTGWSWGASAFDLDNDGFPDLYVANGHESKQSVRDYETEFWMHDIYVGDSRDNLAAFAYFRAKSSRTRGRGMSYGGYEHNRLFLNLRGESFVEAAHLFGVALQADSRNVVADDLDGDGRMDLLVTTFEVWPQTQQVLHIYQNTLPRPGHWIGFRLPDGPQGLSSVGARITLRHSGRTAVAQIVTGESFRAQQACTVHFGLGDNSQVDGAEIHWLSGRSLELPRPEPDRYHTVLPPGAVSR